MELALQEQKRANEDLKQELKDQDELIGKSKHTGGLTQSFSTFPSPIHTYVVNLGLLMKMPSGLDWVANVR